MGFPNVLQTKVGSNISPLKSSYKKALPSPASAIDAALKFMRDCTAQQRGEKIAATIPILCVALEGAIFWSNKLYINVDVNPGVLMYTSWYIGKEASRGSTMDGNSNNNINNNSENESSSASSISPLQREIFEVLKMNYINLHNITRQNIYYSNVKRRESSISNISKYLYKSHGLPKAFPFEREQRNYLTPIEVYWVTMANENKGGCDANNNNNNIPNRRPSHSSSAHTNQGNTTNSVMYKTTDVPRTLSSSESSPTVLDSTNATVLPPLCTGRLFPHISSLITQQTDKGNHRNNINNNNYPPMYMAPANTIGYYQSHIVGGMYVNMWHVFADYFGMIFHTVWDVVRGSVDGKYDVMWATRSPRPGSKRYIHWSKPKPLPLFGFFVSFFKRNYVIIDDPDHIYSVVKHGGGDPPNIVLPESEINRSNIIRTMFSTTPQSHNNDGKLTPRSNITVNTTRDKSNDPLQTKKDSIALHFNILLLGLKNSCSVIHDHIDTMECRNNIWTMRNHILRDMYGLDPNKRVCMRQENTDSVSRNKHIVENNNIVNITALSKNINKSINTTDVPVITKSDCSNATFIVHVMDRQKATYRRIYPYYQTIESITSAVSKYFTTPNRYSATTGRNMTLPVNSFIKEGVKYQIANIRLHRGMSFREQIMTVYNSSMLFAGRGAGTALCLFLPIGGGYLSVSVQDRWNPYMDLSLWWLTIHHHKATLVHHSNSQLPPKRFGKKKAVDFNRAGYLVIPHEVESSVTGLLKAMGASLYMNVSLVG